MFGSSGIELLLVLGSGDKGQRTLFPPVVTFKRREREREDWIKSRKKEFDLLTEVPLIRTRSRTRGQGSSSGSRWMTRAATVWS